MKNVHCSHHYLYFPQCSTVASVFVVVQLTTNWYLMTDTVIHLRLGFWRTARVQVCSGSLQWITSPVWRACSSQSAGLLIVFTYAKRQNRGIINYTLQATTANCSQPNDSRGLPATSRNHSLHISPPSGCIMANMTDNSRGEQRSIKTESVICTWKHVYFCCDIGL